MGTFVFKWPKLAEEVYVTGTFDDWSKSVKLEKKGDCFEKDVELTDASQKIYYKFVVDGSWVIDEDAPKEADESGNINNVLTPESIVKAAPATAAILTSAAPVATTAELAKDVPLEEKKAAAVEEPAVAVEEPAKSEESIKAEEPVESAKTEETPAVEETVAEPAPVEEVSAPVEEPAAVEPAKAVEEPAVEEPVEAPATEELAPEEPAKADESVAAEVAAPAAAVAAVAAVATGAGVTASEKAVEEPTEKTVEPVKETMADAPKEGPGAFPETPVGELDKEVKLINPLPAAPGAVNPITLAPGEKIPESLLLADTGSNVKLDPESYEKADTIIGGFTPDQLPPVSHTMIPESSLPIAAANDVTVNSVAPVSTTAALAAAVPLEKDKAKAVEPVETTESTVPAGLTDTVPEIVKESQVEAGFSPEASAIPEEVKEKEQVEEELLKKVPEAPAAAESSVAATAEPVAATEAPVEAPATVADAEANGKDVVAPAAAAEDVPAEAPAAATAPAAAPAALAAATAATSSAPAAASTVASSEKKKKHRVSGFFKRIFK